MIHASSSATGTIIDNDPAPTFQISANSDIEGGNIIFTVTRTGDAQPAQLVPYSTGGGTATPGADYLATAGTLTFNQGDTVKTFTVALIDDPLFEIPGKGNVMRLLHHVDVSGIEPIGELELPQ